MNNEVNDHLGMFAIFLFLTVAAILLHPSSDERTIF
jgi:hypothetical protein